MPRAQTIRAREIVASTGLDATTPERWPLVARGPQLQALSEAMEQPGCRGAVLGGCMGAGKSRLVAEATHAARERGWCVVEAFATGAAASVALGVFAPVLDVSEGPVATVDLLCRAKAAMMQLASGRRLAVVVDDAHFLDDVSATLIHELATSDAAFVVVSVTVGMPAPDAVTALAKEGWARLIDIPPLPAEAVDEMVTRALGGHVEGGTVQALGVVARGLPRRLADLLSAGLVSEQLSPVRGLWRWRGPMLPEPAVIWEVEQRLGVLTPAERQLLRLLAVGGPLDAAVVESLSSSEVMASTDDAGLLQVTDDYRGMLVGLADPLHEEILRATITPLQLRSIQRQLAEEGARATPRNRAERLRYVVWRLDGGHTLDAATLVAAARDALAGEDGALAERLARAVVEAGGGFEATLVLAEALIAQGRHEEGEALLASLEALVTTDEERARLAACRASNLFRHLGRSVDAEAVLRRAETEVSDPGARNRVVTIKSLLALYRGRPSEAVELAASIADEVGRSEAWQATAVSAVALAMSGRTDRAFSALEPEVVATSSQEPHQGERQAGADAWAGMRWEALWFAGRLSEAEALAQELYRFAVADRSPGASAKAAMRLGLVARAQGKVLTAVGWLHEAAVGLGDLKASLLPGTLAALAQASVQADDLPRGEAALAEADLYVTGRACDHVRIELSRAWVAWAQGEPAAAVDLAQRSADLARDHGLAALEAISLHDVARLGGPPSVGTRLREVAGSLDGQLFASLAGHGQAFAAQDGVALLEVAERFATTGYRLYGAETAAEAARAQRQAGRPWLDKEATRLALVLSEGCQGAKTPALVALGVPDMMTRRESEIAGLAASGLSNHEIAGRLGVSARTVENLLYRAYFKLGIHSRQQLPAVLTSDAP
ncbi:MAG: helix-turn-helix transcriptional regulator [Acidimicrobiales bacterium]